MRDKLGAIALVVLGWVLSLAVYYSFYAWAVHFAVERLGKSSHVEISLGIALHYYFYYFCAASLLIMLAVVTRPGQRMRRGTFALFLILWGPPLIYWARVFSGAPNWSALVLVSTIVGIAAPLATIELARRRDDWQASGKG